MSQLEDLLQRCTVKLTLPERMGWGTGFFVAPGWILTSAHVLRESEESEGQPVQVRWQNQENWAQAIVERSLPDPYDLALLRVTLPVDANPPCVYLDAEIQSRDPLYLFGYPDQDFPDGCPVTFSCEGLTGDEPALIKFALGQVRPGMSGSPLLNQRTGKVCGLVKFTRDRSFDLGGGAIPTRVILEQFPQLRELQRKFHEGDRRWSSLGATCCENQFQPYLQSILDDKNYQEWQIYTPLRVERVKPKGEQTTGGLEGPEQQQQVEQWDVLAGLHKYAADHVLLAGKPGSGKSTALQRLLWEAAQSALDAIERGETDFKIPVLIELRDRKEEAIVNRIQKSLRRARLELEEIENLLLEGRFLLLFDGLNEIPTPTIWSELSEFQHERDFRANPRIFTTRELGEAGLGIEETLTLLPLTEPQMQTFIESRLPGRAKILLRQLKDRLRELAETPLLLNMLCDVVRESPDGNLPTNRGELFRQEFARRYQAFKPKRGYVSEDSRRLTKRLLQQLAFKMTQGHAPTVPELQVSKDWAIQILQDFLQAQGETNSLSKASEYLEDLLEWDLLQVASESTQIEFYHQLFQEYYAAEYLLQQLPALLQDENKFKRDYLNYSKWTEAIALMLALLEQEEQALRVVQLGLQTDLKLGARLAGEVKQDLQEKTIDLVLEKVNIPRLTVYLCGVTRSDRTISTLRGVLTDNTNKVNFRKVIEAIGKSRSEYSIKVLEEILECKHYFLAAEAARILGSIGHEAALPLLSKALHDKEPYTRTAVASVLGEICSMATVPDLLLALEDNDSKVQWQVASALVNIGGEVVARLLLQILITQNNFRVQKYVAIALGKLGYEAAVPVLWQALADSDSQVVASASYALASVGNRTAILCLTKSILEQDDRFSRVILASDLKRFNQELIEEFTIPYFIKFLQAEDPYVRSRSAEALGRIGNRTVIPKLLQTMKDNIPFVRWHSALALGEIGDQNVVPILLQFLNRDLFHCESTAIALGLLGCEYVVPTLQEILRQACPDVCLTVLKALRIIGDPEAIQVLLHESENQIDEIRRRAVYEIGLVNNADKFPALRQASLSVDPSVCAVAVRILGKEGNRNEQHLLIQTLQNNSHQVRAAAAEALGEIGDEEAVSYLLAAFESKSPFDVLSVFPKVAEALGKLGSASILPSLKNLLLESDVEEICDAIAAIQNRCKFYNYDIFQTAQSSSQTAPTTPPLSKTSTPVTNHYEVKTEVFQVIEHNDGTVIGKQP